MSRRALLFSLLAFGCQEARRAEPVAPTTVAATAPKSAAPATLTAPSAPIWSWRERPQLYPWAPVVVERGAVTVRLDPPKAAGGALRLSRAGGWAVVLSAPTHDRLDGAALAVGPKHAYVAHFNQIATGCTLHAVSLEDGRVVWSKALQGLGSIAHSKYRNRVQVAVIDGRPTVFGWESSGRYVEQRDADTGALYAHGRLTGERPRPDVPAALHREVLTRLEKAPVVAFGADDFAQRHNYSKVDTPVAEAARAIDYTPTLDGQVLRVVADGGVVRSWRSAPPAGLRNGVGGSVPERRVTLVVQAIRFAPGALAPATTELLRREEKIATCSSMAASAGDAPPTRLKFSLKLLIEAGALIRADLDGDRLPGLDRCIEGQLRAGPWPGSAEFTAQVELVNTTPR